MNLSELVEVYGKKTESGGGQKEQNPTQVQGIGKKVAAKRTNSSQRGGKQMPRRGNRPQNQNYVAPPMPGYIPYDQTYAPPYGTPMYYPPPMMMMMVPPGFPPPMYGSVPLNSAPVMDSSMAGMNNSSAVDSIASSSNTQIEATNNQAQSLPSMGFSDTQSGVPAIPTMPFVNTAVPPGMAMQFAPNFVTSPNFASPAPPPAYPPAYMYPYEPSYLYGYAPPQKRAKRANNQSQNAASRKTSSHHPTTDSVASPSMPLSPGSDSADSTTSSNASSAPSTPQDKQTSANSSPGAPTTSSTNNKPKKIHCEPCEKTFKTQAQYEAHLTTHVPCPYAGCNFSAVKASLKLHELLHINNMFAKLSTPEEIAKYREERKRKFPTMARAKEAAVASSSGTSSASSVSVSSQSRGSGDQQHSHPNKRPPISEDDSNGPPAVISSVSTESDTVTSSNLNDGDVTTETPSSSRVKRKHAACKYWRQGNCTKGEKCSFSHGNGDMEPKSKRPKNIEAPNSGRRHRSSAPTQKDAPTTLFSQFIQSERSKENKLILQCLRYISEHNFLQPSSSSSSTTASSP